PLLTAIGLIRAVVLATIALRTVFTLAAIAAPAYCHVESHRNRKRVSNACFRVPQRSREATMATLVPARTHSTGSTETRRRIWAIVGGSSGNLVEWYDFYVYSFTALYFASAFFPAGNQTSQLLNAAGIFAAGFLMRPIGSWVFGRIADKRGRRA